MLKPLHLTVETAPFGWAPEVVVDQLPVNHHHGLPLLHDQSIPMRAATITPVDAAPASHARFGAADGLPRYSGESASTTAFRGLCSVFTHVAARMACWPPTRPFQAVLQPIRYLLDRSLCFRPERELAGSDFHRRIDRASARHTEQCGRAGAAQRGSEAQDLRADRSLRGDQFIARGFTAHETCLRQGRDLWVSLQQSVHA